ncbi:MAG: PAS domain S-box protein [Spirochaetaceae bacterium]
MLSAAEHLPELVYEFDATGKILFVNQIIEEYGYSRQELLGRDVFQIVHPEDRERAIPLGMIATELVTNALKHAFPGDIRGRILVSLELSGNEATLRVADNGVGLTEPPDSEPPILSGTSSWRRWPNRSAPPSARSGWNRRPFLRCSLVCGNRESRRVGTGRSRLPG